MTIDSKTFLQSISVMIAMMLMIAGVIAAHFNGIASAVTESKIYADSRIDKIEKKIDKIIEDQDDLAKDIILIKAAVVNDDPRSKAKIISQFGR